MIKQVILCAGADQPALDRVSEIEAPRGETLYIGVDGGCLAMMAEGIPLDYAVGDFDSVSEEEAQDIAAYAGQMVTHPSEKDDTDMELALALAIERAPEASYYLFGAIGRQQGRVDHLLSNFWLAYQARFQDYAGQIHFLEANLYARYYLPGEYELSAYHGPDYLSLIAMTPVDQLEIRGAKYELPATNYSAPVALISNEFLGNQVVNLSLVNGLVLALWVDEE